MNKSRKVAEFLNQPILLPEKPSVETADQDECQTLDEHNIEWVQAWKQAVKTPKKHNKG